MWKQVIVSGLSVMLLVGCDSTDKKVVKDSSVVAGGQNTQQGKNETAIYLPGGAGVDFARQPVSDENILFNNNNVRKVIYEFSEDYETIDKLLSSILEAEKYYRHENIRKGADPVLAVSFQKAGNEAIFARYFVKAKGGVDKRTILIMTWPI